MEAAAIGAVASLIGIVIGIVGGLRYEGARTKQSEAEAQRAGAEAELTKAETFKQYIDATNAAWAAVGELRLANAHLETRVAKSEELTLAAQLKAAGAQATANETKRELDACLKWKRESEKRWAETVTMHRAASEVLGYTANGSKPLQEKVDEVNVSIEKLQESLDVESRNT